MNIRVFFALCIAISVGAMGVWYASLPEQSEFLVEKRWTTDQQNIRRIIEDEVIPILYLHDTGSERVYLKGGASGLNTSSAPLKDRGEVGEVLGRFRAALSRGVDPAFISLLSDHFVEIDGRYVAALSTVNFTIVEEKLGERPSPFVPPMVESREEKSMTIVVLSFFDPVQRWSVRLVAEVYDGQWVVTEDLVERYVPDGYIL